MIVSSLASIRPRTVLTSALARGPSARTRMDLP